MRGIIFTLNARDNIYLDLLKNWLFLDEEYIYDNINGAFHDCVSELEMMNLKYEDLKYALIPRTDRREVAFVFDTLQVRSSYYGKEIFSHIIPLLSKKGANSILFGDFIGRNDLGDILRTAFFNHLRPIREIEYHHHKQFCIVYINNMSDNSVFSFNQSLLKCHSYVGYLDLTYSSFMKAYLSTILTHHFLKVKSNIITSYESSEAVNVYGYPFEENGFVCNTLSTNLYSMFLSYKIEREVFPQFESDTIFSINAITKEVFSILEFELKIDNSKLQYLLRSKADNMQRAGFADLSLSGLKQVIIDRLSKNYIYNLSFVEEHKVIKFNIIIEVVRKDKGSQMKLLVALEYLPKDKILRLITMY